MAYRVLEDGRLSMWDDERPTMEGKIFIELVTRWGTVAGRTDGEDSAGRQKFALQEPQELVDRAEAVTVMACNVLRTRCWAEDMPGADEVEMGVRRRLALIDGLVKKIDDLDRRILKKED